MPNTHLVTYKYRLYPTAVQNRLMSGWLHACSRLYNSALELKRELWDECCVSAGQYEVSDWCIENCKEAGNVHSQVRQEVIGRLFKAYDAFFTARKRVKAGMASSADKRHNSPGFRSSSRYSSFTYPQSGFKVLNKGVKAMPYGKGGRKRRWLRLSKIGDVVMVMHRPIHGSIRTCTVKRTARGWFACFCAEVGDAEYCKQINNSNKTAVGLDIGIENFATMSDGSIIANPHFLKEGLEKIRQAQRKLSGTAKGSHGRARAKRKLAVMQQRVADRRLNFHFQTAHRLVRDYGAVICEDMSPAFMLANHHLAQAASDVSISQFFDILAYEGHRHHVPVAFVDPRNTSQECSVCGATVHKELSERMHRCPSCGLELSRDLNAAANICARGLPGLPPGYKALCIVPKGTGGTSGTRGGIMPFHNAGGDAASVLQEFPAGQAASLKPEYRLGITVPVASYYSDARGTIDPE